MTADPMARFWEWLDYVPSGDPPRHWQANIGDTVEVRTRDDVLGRYQVVAANGEHFKLADRRTFHQRGWPLFSGRRARIRARKAP